MKKNIAIITGGNVAERSISLKSAQTVYKHLDSTKYNPYIIELNGHVFTDQKTGAKINLNDFSLAQGQETVLFDLVFLMLHGHPAEDGCLQGYFETIGLKYSGCDHFVSALTFDKQACKKYLAKEGVAMAPSVLIRKGDKFDQAEINNLGLPVFIKPNKNGSSYGVTKVTVSDGICAAVQKAFEYDDEVIIEGFLDGREFSNGVVRDGNDIVVLPVTEIIPQNDFFDYKAKYENESQEITPANLPDEMLADCQAISKKLYQLLYCKGMTRFDYILMDGVFHFLEANTIPGMSEESIVPQQTVAHGWSISKLLDCVVEEALTV